MSLKEGKSEVFEENELSDDLLFKTYHNSIKTNKEAMAKRIAFSTNTQKEGKTQNPESGLQDPYCEKFNKGDYVRATYVDGVDYEAKIVSINKGTRTCIVRYIGFGNECEVDISTLIVSWGKKYRRAQYIEAKNHLPAEDTMGEKQDSREFNYRKHFQIPPLPPVFTDITAKTSEHLPAMLMAWYMSGYYTGIYESKDGFIPRKKKPGKYDSMSF